MPSRKWTMLGASAALGLAAVQPATAALVAYFPFENSLSSGGTVALPAPTVSGTPTYVAGDTGFGQALKFPGGTGLYIQYASAGTAIDLDSTSYTISAKIKLDSEVSGVQMRMFATDDATGSPDSLASWGIRSNGAENLRWRHGNVEGDSPVSGANGMTPGQWYNVVMRYDASTSSRQLIVNNYVVEQYNATVPAGAVNHNLNLRMGDYTNGGGQGFNGQLDDIRIYNEALSIQRNGDTVIGGDVYSLFNAPIPEPTSTATLAAGIALAFSRRSRKSS